MSGETRQIELRGETVAYALKRSRRRTIGFRIDEGGLSVAAPLRLSERELAAALQEKSGWILSKLAAWRERPAARGFSLTPGATLPWLGREHDIVLQPGGVRTMVRREEGAFIIRHDPEIEGDSKTRTIQAALERHARKEALALMTPKTRAYAERLDRKVAKVLVRGQKRRWGSCAPDGVIRLNWRLIGFPEELIDYVCAHEAAHLVVPNHSQSFWDVVETLTPDWKERRARLNAEARLWSWP